MVCYLLDDQMCLDTFSGEFTLEDALVHAQATMEATEHNESLT